MIQTLKLQHRNIVFLILLFLILTLQQVQRVIVHLLMTDLTLVQ